MYVVGPGAESPKQWWAGACLEDHRLAGRRDTVRSLADKGFDLSEVRDGEEPREEGGPGMLV